MRAIGVSNFEPQELQELISSSRVQPTVVQNWMDPMHQDRQVRKICEENNIAYVSYSLFGTQWEYTSADRKNIVLGDPLLNAIASKHSRSVPSVIISWALQSGASVIPRSSSKTHMQDNLLSFISSDSNLLATFLSADEIESINSLDGQ